MIKLKIENHPTVKRVREQNHPLAGSSPLDSNWLKKIALECGVDDSGLVEIKRPELENERKEILSRYPWTKTLLAFVIKMSREPVRSPSRSVANIEMHSKIEDVNHISGKIVARLEDHGIRAVNPAGGFPMEMVRFPGRIWIVSHKIVAVEAGLGHMGIHRNLIHPKFGNFVLLGTILLDREATTYGQPLDYNPCLECNLCVAACPVGAVSADGRFNFASCFSHNYREFMGGFNDWIEQIADSRSGLEYRGRLSEAETASFWQSLAFGPSYKSAYCMAVCPAGEDVIVPYLNDRKKHNHEIVRPLQQKVEEIYVVPGSDAEKHARNRFQHKHIKYVGNGLHPRSIEQFLDALPYMLQWKQSSGLKASYHFTFTGKEQRKVTITISGGEIEVNEQHHGIPDLRVWADSETWLRFIAGEYNLAIALITLKIRMLGSPLWLLKFGKCFPSTGVRHRNKKHWSEPAIAKSIRPIFLQNDPDSGKIRGIRLGRQKWQGILSVNEIVNETPYVKTFRLKQPGDGPLPFEYLPGQFLTLETSLSGIPAQRSYTMASTPSRPGCIEITVKREKNGLVSNYLHDNLVVGSKIRIHAPSGNFIFTGQEHNSIVLVAAGVGITPLMSILRYLTDTHWRGEIFFLLGFRSPDEFIFRKEIRKLENNHENLHIFCTMSQPGESNWSGPVGRIDRDFIANCVPEISTRHVHVCGPTAMMDTTTAVLLDLGVPPENLKKEAFGTQRRNPILKARKPQGKSVEVKFSHSRKSIQWYSGECLLEAAESCGVEIESACRSGTCGSCKVRLLKGKVQMTCDDALTETDKQEKLILTCQALANQNVEIDA